MTTNLRQQELVRGRILNYLALVYPEPVTLPLLQAELDLFGYPVLMEELNFHVAYLMEKGLAATENIRGPSPYRRVTLVKITARGIDYVEGRLPLDEGVYLEPKE